MKKFISMMIRLTMITTVCMPFVFASDSSMGDLGAHHEDAMFNDPAYQAMFKEWLREQESIPTPRAGGNKKLNVTNYQQVNDVSCGPACVYQIFKYLGVAKETHQAIAGAYAAA